MKKYIFTIIIVLLLTACINSMPNLDDVNKSSEFKKAYNKIRQPAVAGQFYPDNAKELSRQIDDFLKDAEDRLKILPESVKAIIAPHAGYVFSGNVAAYGYKTLEGRKIGTAVIICNSHTAAFSGIAVDDSDAWQTPLGLVEVDHDLGAELVRAHEKIKYNGKVHESDHALEVQIPFLQTVLKSDFKILPILFGNSGGNDYEALANALKNILGDNDIVIISTDMSHYPEYTNANKIDKKTLNMIQGLSVEELEKHIGAVEGEGIPNETTLLCGVDGVKTIMALAKLSGWGKPKILEYANSGDAFGIGDKTRVVGYGAIAFGSAKESESESTSSGAILISEDDKLLNVKQKKILLGIARRSVEDFVKTGKRSEFDIKNERLNRKEGAFVTLSENGQLRGCIGQIVPSDKPLWRVVSDMAVSACSEDHRFEPVSVKDLRNIEYEVSVLSRPEKIDDWRDIEMGKHGVIVRGGPVNTGVFLPQVAEHFNNDRKAFLSELCAQKAGLPRDCYKDKNVVLEVFTAQVFSEVDVN